MTPLDRFSDLAAHARQEAAPAVDISGRVFDTLRRRQPAPAVPWDELLFGASSVVAACAAAALFWLGSGNDSFLPLFSPFLMVLP